MPTTTKQPPCCARRTAKLVMDEANLARLARMAADRSERGYDIESLKAKIEEAKVVIENDKIAITDHEAEHAGPIR